MNPCCRRERRAVLRRVYDAIREDARDLSLWAATGCHGKCCDQDRRFERQMARELRRQAAIVRGMMRL